MKMCLPHWNELRDEIENRRGLGQFVSNSGKEVVNRLIEQVRGERSPDEGDPLMDANNMIFSNAIEKYGPWILGDDDAGQERCPLCEIDRQCGQPDCVNCGPGQAARWIEFAGRDVAALWERRMEAAKQ